MNAELKIKWCAALRSGLWKQQKDSYENLNNPKVRCALGVLAAVAEPDHEAFASHCVLGRLVEEGKITRLELNRIAKYNDAENTFWDIAKLLEQT